MVLGTERSPVLDTSCICMSHISEGIGTGLLCSRNLCCCRVLLKKFTPKREVGTIPSQLALWLCYFDLFILLAHGKALKWWRSVRGWGGVICPPWRDTASLIDLFEDLAQPSSGLVTRVFSHLCSSFSILLSWSSVPASDRTVTTVTWVTPPGCYLLNAEMERVEEIGSKSNESLIDAFKRNCSVITNNHLIQKSKLNGQIVPCFG